MLLERGVRLSQLGGILDRRDEASHRGYIARSLEVRPEDLNHGFGFMGLDVSEVCQAVKTGGLGEYFGKKKPYTVWQRGLHSLPIDLPYGEAHIDATFRKLPKNAVKMGPVIAVVSFGIFDDYDIDTLRAQKQESLKVGWLPVEHISGLIPLTEQASDVLQDIYDQAWQEHTQEFAFLMRN